MFPDALFAELEPVAAQVDSDLPLPPAPPVTIVLRQEDAAYIRPELSLNFLPRTNRSWDDLRVLLGAAAAMLDARSVEEVEQRTLDLALAVFPAGLAEIRRNRDGVISASSSVREGQASKLTGTALELVKRAAAERVSLLYLGDSTAIAAPLVAHGEPLGALVIEASNAGQRLDKHHLQLLTGIAAITAPALATQLQRRG